MHKQGLALSEAAVNSGVSSEGEAVALHSLLRASTERAAGQPDRPQGQERFLDAGPGRYSRRLAGAVAAAFSTAESLEAAKAMGLGT